MNLSQQLQKNNSNLIYTRENEKSNGHFKTTGKNSEISQEQIQFFSESLEDIMRDEVDYLLTMYSSQNYLTNSNYNISNQNPTINIIMSYSAQNFLPKSFYFPSAAESPPNYPNAANQIPNPYNTSTIAQPPNMFSIQNPYSMINFPFQQHPSKQNHKKKDKKKDKKEDKKDKKKKKSEKIKDKFDVFECPSGIFSYLFKKFGQNPVEKGLILIEGDSSDSMNTSRLPSLLDSNFSSDWMSKRLRNPQIKITFVNSAVKIDKYRIKVGFVGNGGIFTSWVLRGETVDGESVVLDDVNNSSQVSSNHREATNQIQNKSYLRSIQLEMKGNGNSSMLLRNIEIFGSIKIKKQ